MKVGEVYYCIKDRYDGDTIVNKSGKFYVIKMYDFNFDRNTIWLDNDSRTSIYFYSIRDNFSMRDMYGNIKKQRLCYIFSDYFISIRESRKLKLGKLKNVDTI